MTYLRQTQLEVVVCALQAVHPVAFRLYMGIAPVSVSAGEVRLGSISVYTRPAQLHVVVDHLPLNPIGV